MGLTVQAEENLVQECINAALNSNNPAKITQATERFDLNHDGIVDVSDVTMIIKMTLEEQNVQAAAPAQKIDVDSLIREALQSTTGEPNISDVNRAIDHNLRLEKE